MLYMYLIKLSWYIMSQYETYGAQGSFNWYASFEWLKSSLLI